MREEEEVVRYMEIAERVAEESFKSGRGERVGVVVVERIGGRGKVVAVAGDGRWDGWDCGKEDILMFAYNHESCYLQFLGLGKPAYLLAVLVGPSGNKLCK